MSSASRLFRGQRKLFWALAGAALLLDQYSKLLLWHHPLEGRPPVVIIPRLLRLVSHEGNVGLVFGLGPAWPALYVVLTLLALGLVFVLFLSGGEEHGLGQAALGLVAGGAVGNMLDRLALGMVRDFVDLHWGGAFHWPTFNLADTAICVGVALVIYDSFRGGGTERGPAREGAGGA